MWKIVRKEPIKGAFEKFELPEKFLLENSVSSNYQI